MRQILLYLVFLLIGAGAGLGGWMLVTNPRMQASQTEIDDLKTQLQQAQDKAAEDSKAAEADMAKLKLDLARSRADMTRAASEMSRMQTEVKLLKTAMERLKEVQPEPLTQVQVKSAEKAPVPATTRTTSAVKPKTPAGSTASTSAGVKEYTVKSGDNLWIIAENELGNGARYKEITELNSNVDEKTVLKIGMTIKIPAK